MFSSILHRRLSLGLFGLLFGVMLLFTGCATTSVKEDVDAVLVEPPNETVAEAVMPDETAADKTTMIESVDVAGSGDSVLIATTGPVRYTVFRLSDPPRLILDLPDVDLGGIPPRTEVDSSFIKDISAITYGGDERIGRIIISLKDGVEHEVQNSDGSILVLLKKEAAAEGNTAENGWTSDEPIQEEDAAVADLPVDEGSVVVEVETEPVEAPAPPAKAIVSVDVESGALSTVVTLGADGSIGRYTAFEVENPSRIVVDVWGLNNLSGTQRVKGDATFVKRVRLGRHPEKVRIVLDTRGAEIPPYMIEKDGKNLVLTFGDAGSVEEETALADETVVEVTSEPVVEAVEELVVEPVEEPVEEVVVVTPDPESPVVEEVAVVIPDPEPVVEELVVEPVEEVVVVTPDPEPVVETALAVTETVAGPVVGVAAAALEPVAGLAAVVAAPVVEPAPVAAVPAVKLPVVTVVDFKKIGLGADAKGRLILKSDKAVEFKSRTSKDKMTVILDIDNAVIADELVRTLDATRLKTPVASVSSYLENDDPSQVRILVKLRSKATYNVHQSGDRITVDFLPVPEPAKSVAKVVAKSDLVSDNATDAGDVTGTEVKVPKYTGVKIDLDMMEANITDVLRLLAEVSDLNIIASDDVKGTVSLRLKGVPWDQAFEIILRSKGLDMIQEGNVVRVAPASKINKEREESLAAYKAQEQLEPLVIEFVPISYATADGLISQAKSVMSKRGTVSSETRTNTLIIKDIPSGIAAAKDLIAKLDTPIPQVLIEARIVEASTSFARDLGIQWGLDYQTGTDNLTNTFGSTSTSGQTPPADTSAPAFATRHGSGNYAVNLPATGTAGTLGALGFILGKAGSNPLLLDLRLTAGEQQGKLRTISRPRIITMDNKQAEISQGEKIPFETVSASGTTTTFVDASLRLVVTPHITPDGSVLMKIVATRNSVGAIRSGSGDPSINTKEASTEVLVRDGETTVIGGIVVSDTNDTNKGIPFLKDIPFAGWLFKSSSVSDSQTELLIFITPTIMTNKIVG